MWCEGGVGCGESGDQREVILEEYDPVFGGSAMDAGVQGCGILVGRMLCWLKKLTPRQSESAKVLPKAPDAFAVTRRRGAGTV